MLVLSGLDPDEVDQLREWYCNIKPLGPSIRIIASASGACGFCVTAAGNQPWSAENDSVVPA
jgi:hypothetical protein